MRQPSKRIVAVVVVAAFVTACILTVGSGGFTFGTSAANGTLTPWAYLPFIARQPTPTPTPISCSTVPTLISPANGSWVDTLIPLFTWDSGNDPNATWLYLEIWGDPFLMHMVEGHGCGDDCTRGINQWRPLRNLDNLDPRSYYFWRVYLMCDDIQGPYSEVGWFGTGSGGTILPAPSLRSPANGSTVPGPTVTLRWSSVSGAVEYRAVIEPLGSGRTFYRVVQGTESYWWSPYEGVYEWWATARNDYAWGADSTHWEFTIDPGMD